MYLVPYADMVCASLVIAAVFTMPNNAMWLCYVCQPQLHLSVPHFTAGLLFLPRKHSVGH